MQDSYLLLELGGVIIGLAVLARVAGTFGIPSIPLYLAAGLAFGEGGLFPLVTTEEFIEVGADLGLILLLFMLGLEYSAAELRSAVAATAPAAILDFLLNFTPGLVAGLMLGWDVVAAIFLGGITYISSSGIVAKLVHDFRRMGNVETPVVLSILVAEDLAMALYLPVMAGLLFGGFSLGGALSAVIAAGGVVIVLALALRIEVGISRLVFSHSDEVLLLTILGVTLLVAGVAEMVQISAAVGALLVGIVLSGPAAEGAKELLSPLRDLFAALFFVFFGLSVDPNVIPDVFGVAAALAVVTTATKVATGWWGARRAGVGVRGRSRAGLTLVARGEFSIAIAGLALSAAVEPELGPLAAAYVLTLAVAGPLLVRLGDPLTAALIRRKRAPARA